METFVHHRPLGSLNSSAFGYFTKKLAPFEVACRKWGGLCLVFNDILSQGVHSSTNQESTAIHFSRLQTCKRTHTHIAQNRANDHSTEMHRAGLTTGSYSCSSWTFPNLPVLLHSCVLFHLISRLLLAVTIDGLIHKGIPSSKPPTQMSQQLPQGHPPTCSTRTSSA